jgi:hypothetical protein
MKDLKLNGTILRHEVQRNGQQHFATFIAFEAEVQRGQDYLHQIVSKVNILPFVKKFDFSSSYTRLTESVSEYPVVKGISFAETKGISFAETSLLYKRQSSSGLKYDNPYVSQSQEVLENVSAKLNKPISPAIGIVQHYAERRYAFPVTFDF